ncbi:MULTISPECIES: YciI family protein [Halocynthiibacter]|uniref:YciI family protein n=1 Tax=Halocynthiibacter halioticoli TaxID=2986804 RepID=A0AAE3J0E6_9RHOB|nr:MULTISPECIES: YciI family protein [Halocynthiibacter]MCV6823846.1 YciI family protein [Halocynthiibacter halioticoli]MCW4056847.1 YciI family protein [Halocynthiibacter sp. SDUM655004]
MPRFILAYIPGNAPQPSPDEGAAHRKRYESWIKDNGDAILEPANPFGPSQNISTEGSGESKILKGMMGYTLIEAADMDAATAIAKSCPFLEMGTIDVAPLMSM